MDDLNVGGSTTIESAPTAVTETPGQSTGTEQADSGTQETEGGTEQSGTESGQGQTGQQRRRWSMQDEVKELRAQRRELREQVASFGQMQEELRALREDLNRRNQPQTAKTPANFFADPEARLQALKEEIQEVVARQNEGLMTAFHETREQEYARQEHVQKSASAAEFIRSQQGYDPSDDEDLIEIIGELPKKMRDNTEPQALAEFAWYKLQASRGVGNRSLQKRQAAGIQGQPPGVGFGRKNWNRAEFNDAVDLVEKNPHDPKMTELFNELMAAHKEGRVK
jgi:hypothetical protein